MTSDREAEAIAVRFMGMGYHAVVLRYSVAPARYPVALRQLAKTVAPLRENSDKWHIEKKKIIVSGFSAGGHLAAFSGSILEYGGACRDHGNGKREDPSQWHDPELSGDHFRGSWSSKKAFEIFWEIVMRSWKIGCLWNLGYGRYSQNLYLAYL